MIIDNLAKDIKIYRVSFLKKKNSIKSEFFELNNGLRTCLKLTKMTDQLIQSIYRKILSTDKISNKDLIVCALGGYGRENLAPFSDLDLLFVPFSKERKISIAIEKILYFLWDLGFKVGHAVRDLEEIIETAKKDFVIQTSLLDCRNICGDNETFKKVEQTIEVFFENEDRNSFIKNKIKERENRLEKKDSNSYLLEPNIKECMGGLRDLNLLFWFFKRFYKSSSLDILHKMQVISELEMKKLKKSFDFILTIRCHLHFLSERPNERLTFDLQKSIAESLKYKERESNLSVERMMKHYYLQIKNVKNLVQSIPQEKKNFKAKKTENKKLLTTGVSIEDKKILIKNGIEFKKSPANFINIFLDITKFKYIMHQDSYRFLCEEITNLKRNFRLKPLINKKFLQLLTSDTDDEVMNNLNDCGLLVKVIPEFSRITSQSQFDRYHLYTVDEHTLMAFNLLKKIDSEKKQSLEFNLPKSIIREIKNKTTLYLSILLHDIGKGYGGNHQKIGGNLAKEILKYFELSSKEIEKIIWLIENHLIFSDFALNKDIEDNSVVRNFIKKVNSLDKLRSLYLLTIVDMASVNQASWNDWKAMLLDRLYEKSKIEINKPILMKFDIFQKASNKKILLIQKKVFSLLSLNNEKYNQFCLITEPEFWLLQPIKVVAKQVDFFFRGTELIKQFDCKIELSSMSGVLEVTIATIDRKNLLLRIIENFISNEMEILEARVFTFKNGLILDTFKISVNSGIKLSDKDLIKKKNEIITDLRKSLTSDYKNIIGNYLIKKPKKILKKENSISIDNSSSDTYSIIKVYANNRTYLLHDILKILLSYNLVVYTAKISTYEDFVEDTFHVLKASGYKIKKLTEIKRIEKDVKLKVLERV